jgi:hypothetical protein
MNNTEKELDPIDATCCQAEIKEGSFMTLGPRQMRRCKNVPTCIAVVIKDGKLWGGMALCDDCRKVCAEKMPEAEFQRLKTKEKP